MMLLLTSVCVLIGAPTTEETPERATLAYLRGLQTASGAFRPVAGKEPSLRATVAAVRALGYFGGETPRAGAVSEYLLSCVDPKTGGFADTPGGKPDPVVTSVALMGMAALKLDAPKVRDRAVSWMVANARGFEPIRMAAAGLEAASAKGERNAEWIAALLKEQNKDGTFGTGSALAGDTGGKVACLLRLGANLSDDQKDAIIKALDKAQNRDGGFGADQSDLGVTYRILRTYHMLGRKPARTDDLVAFLAKHRNKDGGYGVAPGQPSSASGCYMVGIITKWLAK